MFPKELWKFVLPFLDLDSILNGVRLLDNGAKEEAEDYVKSRVFYMLPKYKGEDKNSGVKYLSEEERGQVKLTIDNGRFLLGGQPFTSGMPNESSPQMQVAHLFAVDVKGNFFVYTKGMGGSNGSLKVHHSSILAGADVICAGFIAIKNGKLLYISNCSGHYQPQVDGLMKAISLMVEKGVVLSNDFEVKYEAPGKLRPTTYKAKAFIDGTPAVLQNLLLK
ncbi:hypothetical protein [Corallococcus llansteffanensis]|uniref:Uncharacterized protein n=1 Tax=Corallococcus llansteffanensis TaxID=2316731 RepID=A0A3A8QR97_9BACT|nr:hypothetical protein [Corallococcus llansteffanensis]RKH68895.1 hypothetical protein D7V93_00570 [Corallococcus llansteffanensis]